MAMAIGVVVAADVAVDVTVAVCLIGFGSTICTRQEIECSSVCEIIMYVYLFN